MTLLCVVILSCQVAVEPRDRPPADDIVGGTQAKEQSASTIDRDSLVRILMGKFDPDTHSAFVEVQLHHADRKGLFLQRKTYAAFISMHDAAKERGIKLIIRSATRNFQAQKNIWERKWLGMVKLSSGISANDISDPAERAMAILKYSSMPGTSRHHWGTDIDLNAFNNRYFESGEGLRLYQWLEANGATYGFCQPYTTKDETRPHGYEEEKWHWTYMPLSAELQNQAARFFVDQDISGFAGAELAPQLSIVDRYVLGINRQCVN